MKHLQVPEIPYLSCSLSSVQLCIWCFCLHWSIARGQIPSRPPYFTFTLCKPTFHLHQNWYIHSIYCIKIPPAHLTLCKPTFHFTRIICTPTPPTLHYISQKFIHSKHIPHKYHPPTLLTLCKPTFHFTRHTELIYAYMHTLLYSSLELIHAEHIAHQYQPHPPYFV